MLEPSFSEKCLAASCDLLRRRGIDHVVVIRGDLVVQALRGMGEQVSVLVDRAALHRNAVPDGGNGLIEPRRAIDDEKLGTPEPTIDEIVQSRTCWPSARTPSTTSSEIEVALRSSRTRTTVPSRISRTIGPSASERPFQASQSPLTLRQVRLTVLADRAAEQRRQRPTNPPGIGAGMIAALIGQALPVKTRPSHS